MAVASAGPYASLHLAPDRQPHQHPFTVFFTGRMPLLMPNQQRQSTEGNKLCTRLKITQVLLGDSLSFLSRAENEYNIHNKQPLYLIIDLNLTVTYGLPPDIFDIVARICASRLCTCIHTHRTYVYLVVYFTCGKNK